MFIPIGDKKPTKTTLKGNPISLKLSSSSFKNFLIVCSISLASHLSSFFNIFDSFSKELIDSLFIKFVTSLSILIGLLFVIKLIFFLISFIFLYIVIFFVITALLSTGGLDLTTSISAAATSISNVGPGLGDIIGPNGNFSNLSDFSKWILSLAMILGRLELFAVLVLFIPSFWRKY